MARIKPQALLQQSKKKKEPARISVAKIILCSLVGILIVYLLFATYRNWSQRSNFQTHNGRSVLERDTLLDLRTSDLPRYATLKTAKGPVTVELLKDSAPEVVRIFINLCQTGHFKEMLIQRVLKHHVIQAGNTAEPANTEGWTLSGKDLSRLGPSLKHNAFMLGISKAKIEHGGFQLFITTSPDLDEKLIIFGRVIAGEHVIQEIENVDTDEHYRPKSPIGIADVSLHQKI